jgi:hypothetical protein
MSRHWFHLEIGSVFVKTIAGKLHIEIAQGSGFATVPHRQDGSIIDRFERQ